MSLRCVLPWACAVALAGCGREPPPPPAQTEAQIQQVAREVTPQVERAVGLKFRTPPRIALRTRDQVHQYLEHKLETDLPPAELAGVTSAYRLFGLIPDTLDLRRMLLALYTEQVAGYYDPDSTTLYVVQGSDPAQVRLVMAHELVHALQGQYVPLDSLLDLRGDNDRRTAAQAVMEGQATLASVIALFPDQDLNALPEFWRDYRETIRREQQKMPVFNAAPLIIRETLVFPYFGGADFVRWFRGVHADTVPFGPRLPTSTEQILHPDRYRAGDTPVDLRLRDTSGVVWQDNLGEFETRILLTTLSGSESTGTATALGWGGDRYVVERDASGEALVWYSVWDTPQAAARFKSLLASWWGKAHHRAGRRSSVDSVTIGGHAGVRLVDAPEAWKGWQHLPSAAVVPAR